MAVTGCSESSLATPPTSEAPAAAANAGGLPIYESLSSPILNQDASALPVYDGDFSDIERFLLVTGTDQVSVSVDGGDEIAAALQMSDVGGSTLAQFIGLPLFAQTSSGQLWKLDQPHGEGQAIPELRDAIDAADWEALD
ncbi:hypothetical protein [Homoserinibacter sp. GY 40078]|uniref:hypothetical protein n=1 Tax=Homoserinibacter sp. GY 40078 TaxID=2603275 RepID=UPI0011C7F630|nr:hypothetical protein [Homoserinibacter sp. GY 40078]TXK19687.1 hypothetical protein FVQ89_07410 [Homoserinibacter sp. GY 40078]